MRQTIRQIVIFLCICTFSTLTVAGPWFTGPLLAPAGHTLPTGHTNLEVYGLDVFTTGQYNGNGQIVHGPLFRSFVANPIFGHGLTDWLDVQLILPYTFNYSLNHKHNRIGDVAAAAGFQLLEQKDSFWRPDLRFVVQETVPTGRFKNLSPFEAGVDATGLGAYQTQIAFNFQQLTQVLKDHYLRTRLSLSRLYSSRVKINGLSSYGGTPTTHGKIQPGIENDIDLAFEFTLTQNWVAVMEGYISKGGASRFNGILNIGNLNGPTPMVGSNQYYEQALAPALEYNFNANIGLIGGVWMPIKGTNTSYYHTYVLALNAFW